MSLSKSIASTALLLLVSQVGRAQDCTVKITPPPAGSWAEYTTREGTFRLALLDGETRGGKKMIRIEMTMTGKDGPMVMQLLVPGYPYEMNTIEDFVIKQAGQPAMRLSGQMLGMMRSQMPKDLVAEACRNNRMTRVGEETITVPAGTFPTVRYRDASSGDEVWVSESLPFGMVKTKSTRGGEIVLSARGTNARSQITETPQEMKMPGN